MKCPYCDKDAVKMGFASGKQRFVCKGAKRHTFYRPDDYSQLTKNRAKMFNKRNW